MSWRMLPPFHYVVRSARLGKPNRAEAAGEASSHDLGDPQAPKPAQLSDRHSMLAMPAHMPVPQP